MEEEEHRGPARLSIIVFIASARAFVVLLGAMVMGYSSDTAAEG